MVTLDSASPTSGLGVRRNNYRPDRHAVRAAAQQSLRMLLSGLLIGPISRAAS